jgi:hypothetical protein
MKFHSPTRSFALVAALSGAAALLCASATAQGRPHHGGGVPRPQAPRSQAPPERSPAPPEVHQQQQPVASASANPVLVPRNQSGEHLAGWLDRHSNLTPAQQQQALEHEPGFHDLPPQTQQRYRDQLTRLNAMPPGQRSKLLSHTEAMEHLTPEQRGQVRNAMQQWAALPPASHRAVGRAFRNLRDMTPAQRDAYMNSPDIRSQFTDQERSTITNLMAVEPYLPPRNPSEPNPNF